MTLPPGLCRLAAACLVATFFGPSVTLAQSIDPNRPPHAFDAAGPGDAAWSLGGGVAIGVDPSLDRLPGPYDRPDVLLAARYGIGDRLALGARAGISTRDEDGIALATSAEFGLARVAGDRLQLGGTVDLGFRLADRTYSVESVRTHYGVNSEDGVCHLFKDDYDPPWHRGQSICSSLSTTSYERSRNVPTGHLTIALAASFMPRSLPLLVALAVETTADWQEDGLAPWIATRLRTSWRSRQWQYLSVTPFVEGIVAITRGQPPHYGGTCGLAFTFAGSDMSPTAARRPIDWMTVHAYQQATSTVMDLDWLAPPAAGPARHCPSSAGCAHFGDCSPLIEGCHAATDADCLQARICRDWGHCSRQLGACTIGGARDCRQSASCRLDGACTFKGGRCVQGSDEECDRSRWCTVFGLCHYGPQGCHARADADCRTGSQCASLGRCVALNGRCVTRRDEDCRRTPGCGKRGLCAADAGRCVARQDAHCKASEGCRLRGACKAHQGHCRQGSSADCRRGPACKESGACTLKGGYCTAADQADCAQSSRCRSHGECIWHAGLCYPDLCRKRFDCLFKGQCTWQVNGCIAKDNAACRASRICALDGRCTARQGVCVHGSAEECTRSSACRVQGRCAYKDEHCVIRGEDTN